MMSKQFAEAKAAYINGDPRKLAEFVRINKMTDEQAEFVSLALSGEVETQDGRSEKMWTRNLYFDYVEIQAGGALKERLFGNKDSLPKAEIYRKLTKLHGYCDEDAVKKAIARAKKRRDGNPADYANIFKQVLGQGRMLIFPDDSPEPDNALVEATIEALIDKKMRDEIKRLGIPINESAIESIIENRVAEALKMFRDTT